MQGIIEEYWSGVTRRLQIEINVLNSLVEHNGEKGRANEISLAQLLTSLLPSSLGVGTGIIFDRTGQRSAQTDIILFDEAKQPQLLAQTSQLLFPVETAVMAIEVKTTVDSEAINDFKSKKVKLNALQDSRSNTAPPMFVLFGFSVKGATASIVEAIANLPKAERPDLTCIISPGLVGSATSASPYVPELVPLHKTDPDTKEKLSKQWEELPPRIPGGPQVEMSRVIDQVVYPATALQAYGRKHLLGDPARALLLFCELLLADLAGRGITDETWLANYLPSTTKETQVFDY
ncbi:DUF6602 domain-containing protein [Arthrobacter sp. ISL-65]|uniref:DUF6602 domain-containing protein n=1 Tax=Arthrobacter sp. ISL-65 TaxID=2819112 RepID=UPI001BEC15EA|nr:DUF6602 domain-containing protein [Arthrobacter sp. ISL-65]MBT2550538.1 hypothetical protein [Arthrobacter sp. ISL-65]